MCLTGAKDADGNRLVEGNTLAGLDKARGEAGNRASEEAIGTGLAGCGFVEPGGGAVDGDDHHLAGSSFDLRGSIAITGAGEDLRQRLRNAGEGAHKGKDGGSHVTEKDPGGAEKVASRIE